MVCYPTCSQENKIETNGEFVCTACGDVEKGLIFDNPFQAQEIYNFAQSFDEPYKVSLQRKVNKAALFSRKQDHDYDEVTENKSFKEDLDFATKDLDLKDFEILEIVQYFKNNKSGVARWTRKKRLRTLLAFCLTRFKRFSEVGSRVNVNFELLKMDKSTFKRHDTIWCWFLQICKQLQMERREIYSVRYSFENFEDCPVPDKYIICWVLCFRFNKSYEEVSTKFEKFFKQAYKKYSNKIEKHFFSTNS